MKNNITQKDLNKLRFQLQKKDKLKVNELLDHVDFFSDIDLKKTVIPSFTKNQLLILIQELNWIMVDSVDNWEGG